jgi:hypothetical protein
MRKWFRVGVFILLLPLVVTAQQISFEDYFTDRTLRIDYFQIGHADEERVTLDRLYEEGAWPGNPENLIDSFNNGRYYVKIIDVASNALIFSKGFNNLFGEYKTTDPGIEGTWRSYHGSARIPYPKNPVLFVLETRDKTNLLHPVYSVRIDPQSLDILRERAKPGVRVYKALISGHPHDKVDLAWLAEGYTETEYDKFKSDVDRFMRVFFSIEPYRSRKNAFNIYGVFEASAESGVDEPRKGIYRQTALNASFNALGLERYLLTEDNRSLRDMAAHVPYDGLIVLVNSSRYGGGGIYNDYAITTVDNDRSENVFLHEFGHSFSGLGDEYFSSAVAYNDFYPRGIEPAPPNITAFLNPDALKWRHLVSPGMDLPTDWGRGESDSLEAEIERLTGMMRAEVEKMEKMGEPDEEIRRVKKDYVEGRIRAVREKRRDVEAKYRKQLSGKVGLFEGAGYSAKGLYRPEIECIMFSNRQKRFCRVCQEAIIRMIRFYSEE